eukprot:gene2918-5731_t
MANQLSFPYVVKCTHLWAEESTSLGAAIKHEFTPAGVKLIFAVAIESYLDVVVEEDLGSKSLLISTDLIVSEATPQVKSLVRFATRNLIESLVNYMGAKLTYKEDTTSDTLNEFESSLSESTQNNQNIESTSTKNGINENNSNEISTNVLSSIHSSTSTSSSTQQDTPITPPMKEVSKSTSTTSISKIALEDFPKIVYIWRNAKSSTDIIVKYIQGWADKFAGKGAGIEADNTSDGIIFTFSISSNSQLIITADTTTSNDLLVTANFKLKDQIITPRTVNNIKLDDDPMDKLVLKAVESLLKSLYKDLSSLYINESESESTMNDDDDDYENDASGNSYNVKRTDIEINKELELNNRNGGGGGSVFGSPTASRFPIIDSDTTNDTKEDRNVIRSEKGYKDNKDDGDGDVYEPTVWPASVTASQSPLLLQQQQQSSASPPLSPQRKRDPELLEKAREVGIRLEKFEDKGIEEQAVKQLRDMMNNQRNSGLPAFIKSIRQNDTTVASGSGSESEPSSSAEASLSSSMNIFKSGMNLSLTWQEIMNRPPVDNEDFTKPVTKLPISLKAGGLAGGIDIFEGPDAFGGPSAPSPSSVIGQMMKQMEEELPPKPIELDMDLRRMDFLISELDRSDEIMHENILNGFRDVLLCENFLYIMKERNKLITENKIRLLYAKITKKATELNMELGKLVKQQSVRHLQTIYDICEIAGELQLQEDEFLERIDFIRPRFTTELLGYLNYAINEEILSLKKRDIDSTKLPSVWLRVLQVVKQGVFADFESRYERLLEPLLLVIRFDNEGLRTNLFERFVNITAPLDLPYLRSLSLNMISNILSQDISNLPDSTLPMKMQQLQSDIENYLSEDFIQLKIKEFEKNALEQGKTIRRQYRDPSMEAELKAIEELSKLDITSLQIGESIIDSKVLETEVVMDNNNNDRKLDNKF